MTEQAAVLPAPRCLPYTSYCTNQILLDLADERFGPEPTASLDLAAELGRAFAEELLGLTIGQPTPPQSGVRMLSEQCHRVYLCVCLRLGRPLPNALIFLLVFLCCRRLNLHRSSLLLQVSRSMKL